MKNGKVSESVLVRSILKRIKAKREEILCGAGIGTDCAILSFSKDGDFVISTNPVSAPMESVSVYGIHKAVNNIAVTGAEPVGVMLSCMLPEGCEEKELQKMMSQADELCQTLNVQIMGGHTEVTKAVGEPVVTVTGVGRKKSDNLPDIRAIKPGQDVVVSKWIGLEGTVRVAKEHRNALLTRYPERMIDEAMEFEQFLSIVPEAATALKSGVCAMHDVRNGGVFGALFELSRRMGVGLSVNLKQIPVKQETIEICEFFDLNPYELLSGGCLLVVTENGEKLVEDLRNENIPAAIIGETISSNDKIVVNGEETRFLEPAGPDEICKINFVPANKIR